MSEKPGQRPGAIHVCPWWFCYTFDNPLRRLVHRPERLLGPYIQKGMTAMDVGCGMGYFSLGLAKLVGETGRVIAVDLQPKMLNVLQKRAARAGLLSRIQTRRCTADSLGIMEPLDFILTFWMVHEVPEISRFFPQLRARLKPAGKYLLVEPRGHVSASRFEATLAAAQKAGFRLLHQPRVSLSRAALLE